MADKENLFPHPDQVKWVAVPLDAIKALDRTQRDCRANYGLGAMARNSIRIDAIDEFLDVREVKTALEVHA